MHLNFTEINEVTISTVMLPFPHGLMYYETMIFGGKDNGYQERYNTIEDALKGHQEAVKKISDGQ